MAGHRAHGRPDETIAAKQAPATGRKSGSLPFAWFLADDQHDFAKVTSDEQTVKIFFSMAQSHWIFLNPLDGNSIALRGSQDAIQGAFTERRAASGPSASRVA